MNLHKPGAEVFIPDGKPVADALARCDYMGIGAHQDDLEIMAFDGIVKCFGREDHWFCGVTVTNGAGAPRADLYENYTDAMMQTVRRKEQKKAAVVGEYGAQVLLDFTSAEVKTPPAREAIGDLKQVLLAAQPKFIYTHNFADKHPTHVAVAVRTIQALRQLRAEYQPEKVYGCEVWRDLDWIWSASDDDEKAADPRKIAFYFDTHDNIAMSLLGIFDSQVCGGKRYDLATMGRRVANATYHQSHAVNLGDHVTYALDLTPLVEDPNLDIAAYLQEFTDAFARDVAGQIAAITKIKT